MSVNVGAMCDGHSLYPCIVVTRDTDLFVSELVRVSHHDLDLQCGDVIGKFPRYYHCYWSDIRYPCRGMDFFVSELVRVSHRDLDLQCGDVIGKFPRYPIFPLLLV